MSMFEVIDELKSSEEAEPRVTTKSLSELVRMAYTDRMSSVITDSLNHFDALRILKGYDKIMQMEGVVASTELLADRDTTAQAVADKDTLLKQYTIQRSNLEQEFERLQESIINDIAQPFNVENTLDANYVKHMKRLEMIREMTSQIEQDREILKRKLVGLNRAIMDQGAANAPALMQLITKTLRLKASEAFTADDQVELLELTKQQRQDLMELMRQIIMRDFGMSLNVDSEISEPLIKLRNLEGGMTIESKLLGKILQLLELKLETQMSEAQLLEALRSEGPGAESSVHKEVRDVNMMIEANINPLGWRASFGMPFSGLVQRMISEWFSTGKQRLSYAQVYALFFPMTHSVMLSYAPTMPLEGIRKAKENNDEEDTEEDTVLTQAEDSEFGESPI